MYRRYINSSKFFMDGWSGTGKFLMIAASDGVCTIVVFWGCGYVVFVPKLGPAPILTILERSLCASSFILCVVGKMYYVLRSVLCAASPFFVCIKFYSSSLCGR